MSGTLLLAPIPQTAGKPDLRAVKVFRNPRQLGVTAAQLLNDSGPLGQAFRKWLGDRPATKRKASEYLALLK